MADDQRYEDTRTWRKVAPCSRAVLGAIGILGAEIWLWE